MLRQIDCCFSGSGARFPVFVGALRAVEAAGFTVRRLVGNSGGSIVGGLYMSGMPLDDIEKYTLKTDFRRFGKSGVFRTLLGVVRGYMNDGAALERFLEGATGGMRLEQIPNFWAVATNMCLGETEMLHASTHPKMTLGRAQRISSAIPVVFNGVVDGGYLLMDGGVRYNFALDFFRPDGDDVPVIGVKLKSKYCTTSARPGFSEIMDSTIENMVNASDRRHISAAWWAKYAEVDCGDIGTTDFGISEAEKRDLIRRGRDATHAMLLSAGLI